ncbi:MAG: FecR domain-containing protein [Pseudomonadota bacterium]
MIAKDSDYRQIVEIAQDWRDRIQNGHPSDEEMAAFQAWLEQDTRHQEIYEQAEIYWAAFDYFRPEDVEDKYRRRSFGLWLSDMLHQTSSLFAETRVKFVTTMAAFASVAFLIIFIQHLSSNNISTPVEAQTILASYSAGVGETQRVELSDGTIATLGADTKLNIEYYPDKRVVHIESGAALFDIVSEEARPFSVKSNGLIATALGTVFEVRSNGGVMRVGVAEGRVLVSHPQIINGEVSEFVTRRELQAGQQIAATKRHGLRRVESISLERVGAWRQERLIYKGATLAEIVADANRYSRKDIQLKDISSEILAKEINASFHASDIDAMIGALPDLYPVTIDESIENMVHIRPRS